MRINPAGPLREMRCPATAGSASQLLDSSCNRRSTRARTTRSFRHYCSGRQDTDGMGQPAGSKGMLPRPAIGLEFRSHRRSVRSFPSHSTPCRRGGLQAGTTNSICHGAWAWQSAIAIQRTEFSRGASLACS